MTAMYGEYLTQLYPQNLQSFLSVIYWTKRDIVRLTVEELQAEFRQTPNLELTLVNASDR